MAAKDYFLFETIRDQHREIVCYYVTVIGTIEHDGIVHLRTDLGKDKSEKMAFGKVTVRNLDKKIGVMLKETHSRTYYHVHDDLGSENVISFSAKGYHADEAYDLEEGDRVMIQGRIYLRQADQEKYPGRLPEVSITASGIFKIGRVSARRPKSMNASLIPQKL